MSSGDEDHRNTLEAALQSTSLNDKDKGDMSTGDAASTDGNSVDKNNSSGTGPENNGDKQEKNKGRADDEIQSDTVSPQGQGQSGNNVSFAASHVPVSGTEDSSEAPKVARRKSSMSTIGSRLKRASSAEKHVTIMDAAGDLTTTVDSVGQPKEADILDDKNAEDEETKKELAKILMQFDPLADSKQRKGDRNDDTTTTTLSPHKGSAMNPEVTSPSPNLTLSSSSSSPRTPQQLGSPRTSHDVQVAMSEKAKSSKKKSESRQKSTLSSGKNASNDRGSVGSSTGRSEPIKSKDPPFDFQKFLEQMRHRSAMPITRYFQSFLKEFDRKPWTVNEQIKIIHDFLDFITGKMEMCDLWRNATDQEFENVKEGMEKLVMNRLFAYTFSPSTTDDAERDEVLTQKIRIFRWVREEHLDIPSSPHNETYLNNAQGELRKINSYKAPRDKVICILNCCKFIFTLIRRSEGNSKGADTFLPILIYVVLRSNPPNLVSNVQYISRFRNPDKLQAEAGYYLASLMGAISFIENLEASSLSISPEEFDQQIEKTMTELSQEKAEVAKVESTSSKETGSKTIGLKKQDSKLATLVAGTAAMKASRQRQQQQQQQQPINEKQALAADAAQQVHATRSGPESSSNLTYSKSSGSSILNPTALIERGANFATKTMQKPLDLIERIFQDSGDEGDMAKPYPPRLTPQQQPYSDDPPRLPPRSDQYQPQSQSLQRPEILGRNDSFTEFVYVPAGQQIQQPSPQQPAAFYQQQQQQEYPGTVPHTRQGIISGTPQQHQQQQQHQQPQNMEGYLQALEALTDMFPSCERQVCDAILQANDGRLSPSIDTLLEISSANDSKQDTANAILEHGQLQIQEETQNEVHEGAQNETLEQTPENHPSEQSLGPEKGSSKGVQ